MTIDDPQQALALAARLLRIDQSAPPLQARDLPEIDGFFVWQKMRGGIQLLVARDGEVMFGLSAYDLDELVERFRAGERTSLDRFPGSPD